MNSISSWLCTNSSKNLFVKIVHPGGHVELHDRPILAAELLNRNPKCCVAHPTVFKQPYAIVSPETTLVLGQKYYVVPLGTIRKLQRKCPPSVLRENHQDNDHQQNMGKRDDDDEGSACWLFRNNKKGAGQRNENSCCLQSMSSGFKMRAGDSESSSKERKTGRRRKANEDSSAGVGNGGSPSPGRLSLASNWQPGLESVSEE
ncbi:UNVERIFIED_CONTAM: hypothetical protein Scaly_0161700 [Sesamum calycinum]|uniref:DUF4228 domain protein n=2 Tax=Sesamum TaxID=4181 RepID=A0AAW2SXA0_9LAMI